MQPLATIDPEGLFQIIVLQKFALRIFPIILTYIIWQEFRLSVRL